MSDAVILETLFVECSSNATKEQPPLQNLSGLVIRLAKLYSSHCLECNVKLLSVLTHLLALLLFLLFRGFHFITDHRWKKNGRLQQRRDLHWTGL